MDRDLDIVGRILIVDNDPVRVRQFDALLKAEGHTVAVAYDRFAALASSVLEQPDVILLSVALAGSCGLDLCRTFKRSPSTRMTPVVLMTTADAPGERTSGIEAGADDLFTTPINTQELRARVRSLIRLRRQTDDLECAQAIILSLALTIEARDSDTGGHCQRLARYATALGSALKLGPDDLETLRRGAFLHDLGKIGVPDAILLKQGRLTPFEYDRMKLHTVIGDRLCVKLRSLTRVRAIVRHHHERFDGSGYPDGLRGDAIPLLAQIIGLVDVFDALTTARPYKCALPDETAFEELVTEVRRGWRRRDLVDELITLRRAGKLDPDGHVLSELSPVRWEEPHVQC
ncbi:MAG: response regulator [Vicinamibacterales bacterium]